MNEISLDRKVIHALLIVLGIHSGGLILSSILNNFYAAFLPYAFLPWTRLLVVVAEIILITDLFKRLARKSNPVADQKQEIKMLLLTVALFIGSQFRNILDHSKPFFCANAVFEGSAQIIYDTHAYQQSIVSIVETFVLGMAILIFGILNLKK